MFGWWNSAPKVLHCPNEACKPIPVEKVLFLCPNPRCPRRDAPMPGKPDERKGESLFTAHQFGYRAPCPAPDCGRSAWMKVCPQCWKNLPVATGNSSLIAVIGTSASGKTCFVTSLIHQLHEEM